MIFLIWLLDSVAILVGTYLLPGAAVSSLGMALIVAVVLGLINMVLKPVLLFLTLPINILTLGLFTIVINALLIMLTDYLLDGFTVGGFWNAVLLSLIIGVFHILFLD